MKTSTKVVTLLVTVLLIASAVFVYFKFFFVLGEGVKAGQLNQIVYKGWVWKTYEGRLIMTGFRGSKDGGSIESNQFDFSVKDKAVADSLMRCSGKMVELRYKEYNGRIPWRGRRHYIVYQILSVSGEPTVHSDVPMFMYSGEGQEI